VTERQAKERLKSSSKPWLVLGLLLGLLAFTSIIFSMWWSEGEPATVVEQSVAIESARELVDSAAKPAIVDDDGKSLWVSPTAGAPISLRYLPLGTQLLLHVRPAELLTHAEGEKILAAFGPWGEGVVAHLEQHTNEALADVEELTVAVHPGLDGKLHYTWRLLLSSPPINQASFTVGDRMSFFPAAEQGRVLVSCSVEDLDELKEQGEAPALFSRDIQRLLDRTDDSRSATLVFSPNFLRSDGHKLLSGEANQLEEVLEKVIGAKATAVAVSADWGENFFLELQSTVTLDQPPHRFGSIVQQRLPRAVDALEEALLSESSHPYGENVVTQLPAMLRYLSEHTRGQELEGVSVLRCYLPAIAGHNLLMAAELMLNLPKSDAEVATVTVAAPRTVAEKLLQVTSLSFSKETLEQALETLADDLDIKIEIAGRDLQLEGITKNQSFGIDLKGRPAGEILLAVLQLANPDRTASGPADVKQKLIYVLDGKSGAIVVTTRSAATQRGEQLPEVFLRESAQE